MNAPAAVTIVGAGAIGGVVGAYLARAGWDVTLVDREAAHVQAIRDHGLRISGIRGDFRVPLRAIVPEELAGPLDFVILAVKAMHTEAALEPVVPHLAADGFVLSMQNGLNEEVIARRIGAARTVGCFVHFGADYQEPGHILLGNEYPIQVGELDGARTPRVLAVQEALQHVMPTSVTDNLWGFLWGKMCYAALAYAGALTDQPTHELLAARDLRPVLAAVVRETARTGQAQGYRMQPIGGTDPYLFLDESPEGLARLNAHWDQAVEAGRRSTSLKVFTGIQRDLMVRHRRTEVDAHMGPVLERAERLGLPMPLTRLVVAMIHEEEDGARALSVENLRELAARGSA